MNRLYQLPDKYINISLKDVGVLFLATPHSGSLLAGNKDKLVNLGDIFGLTRGDLIEALKPFNDPSVASKEIFATLQPPPPYYCIAEGRETGRFGKVGVYRLL